MSPPAHIPARLASQTAAWMGYLISVAAAAAVSLLFLLVSRRVDLSHDVQMLYLPIVIGCAVRFGIGPAMATAAACVLFWDFFFIRPLYSLHIGSLHDAVMLGAFLAVSIVTGRLAESVQRKTREAATLDERNRMARDIHDTLAQGLTGIVIQLQAAERLEATDAACEREAVHSARVLAEQCLEEARRSVKALRPGALETMPLADALAAIAAQMCQKLPVNAAVRATGNVRPLPEVIEAQLLRIGTEALTNALRHANAQQIDIDLCYETDRVLLCVEDDGDGFDFDTTAFGFGLAGMRERAEYLNGTLTLDAARGKGTRLQAAVPLAPAGKAMQ